MTAKREAPSQRGAIRSAMPATWAASKTCSRRESLDGAMPNAIGAFGMFDDQLHDTPAPRLLGPLTAHQPYEQVLVLLDRKSTRLNSSHVRISYAVFCLKKKNHTHNTPATEKTIDS